MAALETNKSQTALVLPSTPCVEFVAIKGHVTVLADGSTYTVFCVCARCSGASPPEWEVFRRYSHFELLAKDLKSLKCRVPPVPSKSSLSTQTESFLSARGKDLERWMTELANSPQRGEDPMRSAKMLSFLTDDANQEPETATVSPARPAATPSYSFFSGAPSCEVNVVAPYQGRAYRSDYKNYQGPISDKMASASIPGQAAEGPAAQDTATTVSSLFLKAAQTKGDKVVLRTERPCPPLTAEGKAGPSMPVEEWKAWTINEYLSECRVAARAFMGLGVGSKDAVAIYGFNAPEWIMSEVSAILAGGIAAGIYPTDTPTQVAYKAQHSGAVVACVETIAKAHAFLSVAAKLPKLKAIVVWDPDAAVAEVASLSTGLIKVLHWSELHKEAESVTEEQLAGRIEAQKPSDCCAYIYTSGTTGAPKAVMISHDNIVFESRAALTSIEVLAVEAEEERVISYLPLSHVAGMMVDIVCPLVAAAELPGWVCCFFARNYDLRVSSIVERFQAVRPTMFLGVPRVWEKIEAKMKASKAAAIASGQMSSTSLKVSEWGKAMSLEHAKARQLGGDGKKASMFHDLVAEGLVQKKVKALLGLDQCKFAFTGAAPISTETLSYFASIGVNINEVYGMSECTGAATWSTDKAHVWGSVGWAMAGCEVKVFKEKATEGDGSALVEVPAAKDLFSPSEEEQGELCYRGRNVMMGYLANPDLGPEHVAEIEKKTKEAVDDQGWLHSGDKGCVDKRGMFRVTGRYKELLIGAGGENIAPVPIEDNIKALCPAIANVMMVGDKQPFNCLLVTLKAVGATGELPGGDDLDSESLAFLKSVGGEGVTTVSGVVAAGAEGPMVKAIAKAISDTNKNGDVCPMNASKVQKFTILPLDFSVASDDFTPTFKLKRSFVHDKYGSAIKAMYASKETYVPFAAE